ncbi:class I SAM-dependent methyltransferase [Shewanella marina]|uniref:class I SAM-dependent methyltransferase n=1 Tax=Shewanella marina TaxID=487319 RepID=UPI00046F9A11|nr:class I SAM-dependent methyltransferase [Shewanella marina]
MDYLTLNKEAWNKRAALHVSSTFYDVNGFLSGKTSLNKIELNALNDVQGKRLLHLQCHFGLDTLSWARLGAEVTGVDLSETAIEHANSLAKQSELAATFICRDVIEFGRTVNAEYDIVFTSYGVLCWMPDINLWAQTVANSLKEGGTFYLCEFHPYFDLLSGFSYFHQADGDVIKEGTYTENCDGELTELITWSHPISDVVNALIKVGIQITELNEYPYSPYNCFDGLELGDDGFYYVADSKQEIPLLFEIKGVKC